MTSITYVNIDTQTNIATIHLDGCRIPRKYKDAGKKSQHGRWVKCPSLAVAEREAQASGCTVRYCKICNPK